MNLINDYKSPMKQFESEEKQIILTVHQIIGSNSQISFSKQAGFIVFRIHNLLGISYEKMKRIMLSNDNIKNVVVNFGKANTVSVYISKNKNKNSKILLISKRRRQSLKINNQMIHKCALKFLQKKTFRMEDRRYLEEIVTKIIKWSLGGKAVEMDLTTEGDIYKFYVANLSSISYLNLKELFQIGDWVKNVDITFHDKQKSLLRFDAIRSINYINENSDNTSLGKRKHYS